VFRSFTAAAHGHESAAAPRFPFSALMLSRIGSQTLRRHPLPARRATTAYSGGEDGPFRTQAELRGCPLCSTQPSKRSVLAYARNRLPPMATASPPTAAGFGHKVLRFQAHDRNKRRRPLATQPPAIKAQTHDESQKNPLWRDEHGRMTGPRTMMPRTTTNPHTACAPAR